MSDRSAITRDRLDPRNIELPDPAMISLLQRQDPAQRVMNVYRMYDGARQMIRCSVKRQHPRWSEQEIETEVIERLWGARSAAYREVCRSR